MTGQHAEIDWSGGTPVARAFDDPYFSLQDGVAETRHVFLGGNGLPGRFGGAFRVAELGFGTGLNLLVTLAAWEEAGAPGTLSFTSFEAFPLRRADARTALAAFDGLSRLADLLIGAWPALGSGPVELLPRASLDLRIGDARSTLPAWEGLADAWYLDGFAPARNPELWGEALMAEVGRHTAPGSTFATYTAAGHVRRALTAAGFEVERVPGFGRKRHMTRGRRP